MLLSARMLEDLVDVNHFGFATQVEATEGDSPTFFIQLTDAGLDSAVWPRGRRYMPQAGATLSVTLQVLDSGATVTKVATQPFAQDPSIWSFGLAANECVPGTRALKLMLTEGLKVTNAWVEQAVVVSPLAPEF
jgi:hypothetical protein